MALLSSPLLLVGSYEISKLYNFCILGLVNIYCPGFAWADRCATLGAVTCLLPRGRLVWVGEEFHVWMISKGMQCYNLG